MINQMDLVSSIVMLVTSRLAAKPNVRKFPVVRMILPPTSNPNLTSWDCRAESVWRLWGSSSSVH